MKKNRVYLKPYIRRAKPKDFSAKKAADISVAINMTFYEELPKCYVLVQRGSNKIVGLAETKDEIKHRVPFIQGRGINKRFNRWKNKIKHYAQDN